MRGETTTTIRWRLRLAAPPARVYEMLATAAGRERFWAESAPERDGAIEFTFPDGQSCRSPIRAREPGRRFALDYFGGSRVTFELAPRSGGGTELTLVDEGVAAHEHAEVLAGWVSVLLALKAAVDFGADLRNHDRDASWAQGYAEN